jgi:hypothetical protein
MAKIGRRVRILRGAGTGHFGTVVSEPVSGTAKGELVVQVKLDGEQASVTYRVDDIEYVS